MSRQDEYKKYFDMTLDCESDSIKSLKDSLDYETMEKIVDLLIPVKEEKRRVITAGCGTSGAAAKRIAHILSCVETPAMFLSPSEAAHGGMGFIQKDDIVVLLSKGGNTGELLNFIECCKTKGAILIAVTNNAESVLAKTCDYTILIDSGEEVDAFKILPCASTLDVIATWDAIAHTIMRYNGMKMEDLLLIHPNGNTAERLINKINNEK